MQHSRTCNQHLIKSANKMGSFWAQSLYQIFMFIDCVKTFFFYFKKWTQDVIIFVLFIYVFLGTAMVTKNMQRISTPNFRKDY